MSFPSGASALECCCSFSSRFLLCFFFFFFQAEDGIRDLYVTGVQTCALPILDVADLVPLQEHGIHNRGPRAGVVGCRVPEGEQDRLRPCLRGKGQREGAREIGRASCRERVKVGGGGGAVKKKRVVRYGDGCAR